eukprot:GEMP01007358.1.p1 GENE.GEMP01007358.1~~GEMP01007358.1.p1  ORF type:complete len:938 (+),score=207.72 GEMP01007358.1:160-2973(+)
MVRDGAKSARSRSNSTATKSSSASQSLPKNAVDANKEATKEANKEETVKKMSRKKNSAAKAKERKGRKSISSSRPKSVGSEKKEKVPKRNGKSKKRTSTKTKERARSTSSSPAKSDIPAKKEKMDKKTEKKKRAKSVVKKKARKSLSRLDRKSTSRKRSASPPPKKKRAQSRSISSKSRKKSSSTRRPSPLARDKSLSPRSKKSVPNAVAGRTKSASLSPAAYRRTTKRKKSPPAKARRSKSASASKSRSRSRSNKRTRNTRARTPTPDARSRAQNKKRVQSASRRRTNTRSGRSPKHSYSRRHSYRRNERNNRSYRRGRYASRSRGRGRRGADNRRDRSRRRSRTRSRSRSRSRSRTRSRSRSRRHKSSRSRSRSHATQKKRNDKRHNSERRSTSSSHGRSKKAVPAVVSTASPVKKRPTRTARSASSSDSGSAKSLSTGGKNNKKEAKRLESVSSEQSSDREIVPMMTPEERLAAALRHIETQGEMFVRTLADACETGEVLVRAIEQAGGTTWESGEFVLGYMPKVAKNDGLGGPDSTVPTILVLGTTNGDDDDDQEAEATKEKEGEASTVAHFAENEDTGEMMGTGLPGKAFVLAWIHAANAFWASDDKVGGPPVNVKFVLAKNGRRYNSALSGAAATVVLEEKEFFKGVDVVIGRGASWLSEEPTIYLGNRGLRTFEVTICAEGGLTTPRNGVEENDIQERKPLAPLGIEHAGAVVEPLAELVDLINAFKDSRSVTSGIEASVINPPSLDEYKSQVKVQVRGSTAEDALKNRTVRPAVCFHNISAQPCGPFEIPLSACARLSLVSTEWAEDGNALRLLQNLYSGHHTLKVKELQNCRPWGSASASSQFVHKLKDAVTSILPVQLSKIHVAIDGTPSASIMSSFLNNLNPMPALSLPMSYRASKESVLTVMGYLDYTKILATFIDRVGDKKIIL